MEDGYRYLEDMATADIAFESYGKTLKEAFENAGRAVFGIITDISCVKKVQKRDILLESEDVGSLLFDWIDEILFYWDSERLVFSGFDVNITKSEKGYILNAVIWGEEIDPKKHEIRQNVKSPTYHMMKIEEIRGRWILRMVLDL